MKAIKLATGVVVAFGLLWLVASVVHSDDVQGSMPTVSATDGRFVGLAGTGLQPGSTAARFWVSVPMTASTLKLDVFDGDLGGFWDIHDPVSTTLQTQYLLYADPTKSGNPISKTLIVSSTSTSMRDNDWTTLYSGPVHLDARAASGNYFYLLVVQWNDASLSGAEFNAFKLRGGRQISIVPGQWSFAGAPINLAVDPPLNSVANSDNGEWNWYVYVPPPSGLANVSFTDCDADYRASPTAPGAPGDDDLADPRVRIPPDIRYAVFRVGGSIVINNLAPSGHLICSTKAISDAVGGIYQWYWAGVDAHNIVNLQTSYEVLSVAEAPLSAASPTPTATPSPSATPTATATATATATSTDTDTPTVTTTPATATPTVTTTPATVTATPTVTTTAATATPTTTASPGTPGATREATVGSGQSQGPTGTATPTLGPTPRSLPPTGDGEPTMLTPFTIGLGVLALGALLKTMRRHSG